MGVRRKNKLMLKLRSGSILDYPEFEVLLAIEKRIKEMARELKEIQNNY